jgi:hypothetical protein
MSTVYYDILYDVFHQEIIRSAYEYYSEDSFNFSRKRKREVDSVCEHVKRTKISEVHK